MRYRLKFFRKNENGAALAETAITIMTFLMIILGIVQLTLVINARLLVNYAAYEAARAGALHNGDEMAMQQAAALALSPLFAETRNLAGAIAELAAIKIEILSPAPQRFRAMYDQRFFPELTPYGEPPKGKDRAKLDDNLLTVKVTYDFPLEIPLINTILKPFSPRVALSSIQQMRMQSDNRFH